MGGIVLKRKIIKIDEEKCNGCGLCAAACHEGAIGMVEGKARLLREDYCDGLGDCLPACPMNAISFEEREAPAYDHQAVLAAKAAKQAEEPAPCGCPGSRSRTLTHESAPSCEGSLGELPSELGPVAGPDQARAGQGSLFRERRPADCRRLHRLCLWRLSPAVYPWPGCADRLPQTGPRGIMRKSSAPSSQTTRSAVSPSCGWRCPAAADWKMPPAAPFK